MPRPSCCLLCSPELHTAATVASQYGRGWIQPGVAIAWLAARRVFQGSAQGMGFGGVVWVLAVVTGLGIWWARHATVPHWSFIIVASVTSALLLFGWRLVVRFVH